MTGTGVEHERAPVRVSRTREGRVLGGVCAGLPKIAGLGTSALRLVFVLAALCGGIGVVVYLACWLVIPAADEGPDADGARDVVLLAWAVGGMVALMLLAVIGAAATVFGLGWVMFGLAGVVVVTALTPLGARIPSVAALLTVAALTLPAVAVALSPVRLTLRSGASVSRPAAAAKVRSTVFRSSFETQLIDLRHTRLPSSGSLTMRIDAGLRRTIVALPADRCVRVRVDYTVHTFTSQLAALLSGHQQLLFHDVVLFGSIYGATSVRPYAVAISRANANGLTLTIDFSSQGGSLYVRDYPDDVSPDADPYWPGLPVTLTPKPDLRGLSRKNRKATLRGWQALRRGELDDRRRINRLMPGPCVR